MLAFRLCPHIRDDRLLRHQQSVMLPHVRRRLRQWRLPSGLRLCRGARSTSRDVRSWPSVTPNECPESRSRAMHKRRRQCRWGRLGHAAAPNKSPTDRYSTIPTSLPLWFICIQQIANHFGVAYFKALTNNFRSVKIFAYFGVGVQNASLETAMRGY